MKAKGSNKEQIIRVIAELKKEIAMVDKSIDASLVSKALRKIEKILKETDESEE